MMKDLSSSVKNSKEIYMRRFKELWLRKNKLSKSMIKREKLLKILKLTSVGKHLRWNERGQYF
jgi:hypothetical protein